MAIRLGGYPGVTPGSGSGSGPVPLTRSPAEVSALNALRRVSELLLQPRGELIQRPQSASTRHLDATGLADGSRRVIPSSSSVVALRSLCGRRRSVTARTDEGIVAPGALGRWLALAEVTVKLEEDARGLEREAEVHDRKRHSLFLVHTDDWSPTRLPPSESCELGPKLQCLKEVLGTVRFRAFLCDLYTQVASLRRRLELYGVRSHEFGHQVRGLQRECRVPRDRLLWFLNETQQSASSPSPELTEGEQTVVSPCITFDMCTTMFQYCVDPQGPADCVLIQDFVDLLQNLPVERTTLVRHAFEQLADARRGEGYRPPPDYIKIHRLRATLKIRSKYCSSAEMQTAETWLDEMEATASGDVSLRVFLHFHLSTSDATASEDAEFVRFLERLWGFDPHAVKNADRGDAILRLLDNHTTRCHLLELAARKRELLAKIPSAQSRIRSASALVETELQQIRALEAPAGLQRWLQRDASLGQRLGGALSILRELALPSQSMSAIPEFVTSLRELEVLDLHDNRLAMLTTSMGEMRALRRLDLSANLLRDESFAQSDTVWGKLDSLTELFLQDNALTTLMGAFVCIPNLETLDLSHNTLRSIRGVVVARWEGRSKLASLDLHANALTTLPDEICVLGGSLRCLRLHENRLTGLPSAALASLTQLEELSLTQNELSGDSLATFPLSRCQQRVDLGHNRIRRLPDLILSPEPGKASQENVSRSVVSIDARCNRLRTVSEWKLVLANCQELHLQQNALCELPETFFRTLPALRVCELQNNQLCGIPVSITECPMLQTLDVHSNCLQALPVELVRLTHLEVLNAAENQITEVPNEWHAFATRSGGEQSMHTLNLRRNPLRNRILKAVVDQGCASGGNDAMSATKRRMVTHSDDPLCEGVIMRLLDGLRDASVVLRGTRNDGTTTNQAWDDSNDEQESKLHGKCKWCGVARDVNCYLEQRLHAMQRSSSRLSSSGLVVEVKSFERLIRTLPFTCSKRELAHLVRRFRTKQEPCASSEDSTLAHVQVDGLAFLQAIEKFGRCRTLSSPPKTTAASVAKSTVTPVAPLLQYLLVLHTRKQQKEESFSLPQEEKPAQKIPQAKLKPRNRAVSAPKTSTPIQTTNKDARQRPGPAAMTPPLPRQQGNGKRSQADVVSDRQRQRIQVLEQQLLDQKLLLLAHQSVQRAGRASNNSDESGIAPANLDVAGDLEAKTKNPVEAAANTDKGRALVVSIKCPTHPDTEDLEQQQAAVGSTSSSRRLDIRLTMQDSVLQLKQQLEVRTGVAIEQQILVAKCPGRGKPAIRLRNSSTLSEYASHVGSTTKWTVILLIGQSLPLREAVIS